MALKKAKGTIFVKFGNVRLFSDIFGRNLVVFEDTSEIRKDLAERLEVAGCKINLKGNRWLSVGTFPTEKLNPILKYQPELDFAHQVA